MNLVCGCHCGKCCSHTFLEQLRTANLKRVPDFGAGELNDWTPAERGNELAGETGELCNELKKLRRHVAQHFAPHLCAEKCKQRAEILARAREELADVLICADLIGAQLGIDLEGAVRDKFNTTSDKIGSKVKL
jgi:NTP pyrophosphatase (non-canonical NTP hydrolase)